MLTQYQVKDNLNSCRGSIAKEIKIKSLDNNVIENHTLNLDLYAHLSKDSESEKETLKMESAAFLLVFSVSIFRLRSSTTLNVR